MHPSGLFQAFLDLVDLEAAWIQAKAKLEADWRLFEAEVKKYVESFGKQIEHQQATFKLQADAQLKAWRKQPTSLAASQEIRFRASGRYRRRR